MFVQRAFAAVVLASSCMLALTKAKGRPNFILVGWCQTTASRSNFKLYLRRLLSTRKKKRSLCEQWPVVRVRHGHLCGYCNVVTGICAAIAMRNTACTSHSCCFCRFLIGHCLGRMEALPKVHQHQHQHRIECATRHINQETRVCRVY